MEVQHYINATEMYWYQCSRVVFEDEVARWELSRSSRYGLLEAYERKPHRRLIEASDDDSLKGFVKAWGPLRFSLDAWTGSDAVESYRRERDLLRAWVLLLTAVQKRARLHEVAVGLLRLNSAPWSIWIRHRLGIPGSPELPLDDDALSRVSGATDGEILDICKFLVGSFPAPTPSFAIQGKGKGMTLRPTLGTYSLMDALRWMVWQDVFTESPFQFCEECHRLIYPTTKHKRKFCPDGCAQRVAARNWRREDLAKKRLAKAANKEKEEINGANKTR